MRPQLTIEAFADWCEKQPAEKSYNWASEDNCACAQYAKALGMPDAFEGRYSTDGFWAKADQIALRDDFIFRADWSDTFGNLAARLRAAQ